MDIATLTLEYLMWNCTKKKEESPSSLLNRLNGSDLIKIFIENGVDVNVKPSSKDVTLLTPLYYVCRRYRRDNLNDVIQLFLENGADPNPISKDTGMDTTPLIYLCTYYGKDNLIDIVKLFLKWGVDIHVKNRYDMDQIYFKLFVVITNTTI